MQTINLKSARRDIHASIAADIRRVAPALVEVTLPVALANWEFYFQQGRYRDAAEWWVLAHQRTQEGAN